MSDSNKSYRIRTTVGSYEEPVVYVNMDQTYDKFDILSLSLDQTNNYRGLNSDYGVVVGRVLANGGFGIPNAKISVFVQYEDTADIEKRILYSYSSSRSINEDGIRYNLLPNASDDECHQVVGGFPTKRVVLDNNTWIDVFDKYYRYTTRSNNAGDYMIYGVPTGNQTVHVDIDLSDIGALSQRPRDMIYKGYNINQFDSPNKFKKDTNLNSLAQIFTQDKVVYVYPFWGDTTDNELGAAITRCDIDIDYRFEPTCVFMGSIITDTGEDALSKKCEGAKEQGKMSKMITGNGVIEMIRKTGDGLVESYSVKGDRLIDGDGVWCYQIPMNLDYVVTDEYGNTVLSDDPNKGIATRARVRFRISMSDTGGEGTARKRARYLVPNNPRFVEEDYPGFVESNEVDYEFGSKTRDEDFRDLFWNKVYTVKNYIPRLQKSRQPNNKKRTGIKMVNHSGGNNPMPFNSLGIKFNFTYMFLCALLKLVVIVVYLVNKVLTAVAYLLYQAGKAIYSFGDSLIDITVTFPFGLGTTSISWFNGIGRTIRSAGCILIQAALEGIGNGIELSGLCADDSGNDINVNPGVVSNWVEAVTFDRGDVCNHTKPKANTDVTELFNCVENQLAQDNEVTSFNFDNDWVNGVLYMPLWYRKLRPKKKIFFGLFTRRAKDQWCDAGKVNTRRTNKHIKVYRTCSQKMTVNNANTANPMGTLKPLSAAESVRNASQNDGFGIETISFNNNEENCYGFKCHDKARTFFPIDRGLIVKKETMLGDEVYYYRPIEYNTKYNSDIVTLFATDIVLLGSMDSCDLNGIPQFFTALESTTYNMPPDLLVEDYEYLAGSVSEDENDEAAIDSSTRMTENTGADWGNTGYDQSSKRNANENVYDNGGLFYGLSCFNSYTKPKSCVNLTRICEFGIGLDESQDIMNVEQVSEAVFGDDNTFEAIHDTLAPDGFVSYDDIYSMDYRSMFATLNGNWLKTKLNYATGLYEYDFNHLYISNFDGLLKNIMRDGTGVKGKTKKSDFNDRPNYMNNYRLEESSNDYLDFRYGNYRKRNNKKIYYYDYDTDVRNGVTSKDRFPRYENSFYFYFGLNEGKTAIDKFRTEMFVECSTGEDIGYPYTISTRPNEWCVDSDKNDGWGAIFFATNIQTPISLRLTKINSNQVLVYEADNITKQNFAVGYKDGNSQTYGGIEAGKYTFYPLTMTVDGGIPTANVVHIETGDYDVEIVDGDGNVITDTVSFKGDPVSYDCDAYSFTVKNSELETVYGHQYANDVVDWRGVFTDVANAYRDTSLTPGQYDLGNRQIKGVITVGGITSQYFKVEVTPASHAYFGYDWVGTNGTDRYQLLTPTEKVAITGIQWDRYVLAYTRDTGNDDVERVDVAYFVGDNPTTEDEYEAQYLNGRIRCDVANWVIIENGFSIEYVDNYPGCYILGHNDSTTNSIVVDYYDSIGDKSTGYLGYNGNTVFFGAPYGGQKYNVTVTYMCYDETESENRRFKDTPNSVTTVVSVLEPHFKMFLNGIDYDIIKNFRTGFTFVNDDISNIDTHNTKTDTSTQLVNDTFRYSDMFGWNDIDNIGKINKRTTADPLYSVMEPIEYNSTAMSDNDLGIIVKKYLDALSIDYNGNGKKVYNNAFDYHVIDIDAVESIVTSSTVPTFGTIGGSDTEPSSPSASATSIPIVQRVEYGNPYCWTDEYCYDATDYATDTAALASLSNTIDRVAGYTPDAQHPHNTQFSFTDTVNVSYTVDAVTHTLNISDTSIAMNFSVPENEDVDYSTTVHMSFANLTAANKIEMNFNGVASVVDVVETVVFVNANEYSDVTDEYRYYYYNTILTAIKTASSGEVEYMDYPGVSVSYAGFTTVRQKLIEICQRINEVVARRIDFSNRVKNAFRIKDEATSLEITYESNETPIKFKCIGSDEQSIMVTTGQISLI